MHFFQSFFTMPAWAFGPGKCAWRVVSWLLALLAFGNLSVGSRHPHPYPSQKQKPVSESRSMLWCPDTHCLYPKHRDCCRKKLEKILGVVRAAGLSAAAACSALLLVSLVCAMHPTVRRQHEVSTCILNLLSPLDCNDRSGIGTSKSQRLQRKAIPETRLMRPRQRFER